jgi:GNAT superfamily N-acetyltransferase
MSDPIPMAVLGRLAVDRCCHGAKLGAALLLDATERTMKAAGIIGIRAILVHANSESARRFYLHHGFVDSPRTPRTLILSLKGHA